MIASDLAARLAELERRHPRSIELGLDWVGAVHGRLGLDYGGRPVIIVGGTNGKGSVAAFVEAICRAAGHRTFTYTSPHIRSFPERIRLDNADAPAADIVAAIDRVEAARGDTPLTYFEHTTLAGLAIAADSDCDVLVLEVGLGGRLDAVNILDADVAVITQIGLDHADWLGDTRAQVAVEKAGIARAGRAVVVGDREPPPELHACLDDIGARILQAGRDFDWAPQAAGWRLDCAGRTLSLPRPGPGGTCQFGNAACAVVALAQLADRLPVDGDAIARGLITTTIPGRFQTVRDRPEIILDVAHNPDAARCLSGNLAGADRRTLAVFAVLADKDADGIAQALAGDIDHWFCAGLEGERGRSGDDLAGVVRHHAGPREVEALKSVPDALAAALRAAGPSDRVVVFGSFYTVAHALDRLDRED